MSLPNFLKESEQDKQKKEKGGKDFHQKCLDTLEKIKEIDPKKHQELLRFFRSRWNGHKTPKKMMIGLYGQLANELKLLSPAPSPSPPSPSPPPKVKVAKKKKKKKKVAKKKKKVTKKKVAKKKKKARKKS